MKNRSAGRANGRKTKAEQGGPAPAPDVRANLDAALAEVATAEHALDAILRGLRAGARAEKVSITAAVEGAFERLRKARAELAKLKELVEDR